MNKATAVGIITLSIVAATRLIASGISTALTTDSHPSTPIPSPEPLGFSKAVAIAAATTKTIPQGTDTQTLDNDRETPVLDNLMYIRIQCRNGQCVRLK
jgi:hypothetical protein